MEAVGLLVLLVAVMLGLLLVPFLAADERRAVLRFVGPVDLLRRRGSRQQRHRAEQAEENGSLVPHDGCSGSDAHLPGSSTARR